MSKFGSRYVSIEFEDHPCEVCGKFPDDCICPECNVCGVQGQPDCYRPSWQGGHGLTENHDQKIGRAELYVSQKKNELAEAEQALDYLKEQKEAEDAIPGHFGWMGDD